MASNSPKVTSRNTERKNKTARASLQFTRHPLKAEPVGSATPDWGLCCHIGRTSVSVAPKMTDDGHSTSCREGAVQAPVKCWVQWGESGAIFLFLLDQPKDAICDMTRGSLSPHSG